MNKYFTSICENGANLGTKKRRPATFSDRPATASNILMVKPTPYGHSFNRILNVARESRLRLQFVGEIEQTKFGVT